MDTPTSTPHASTGTTGADPFGHPAQGLGAGVHTNQPAPLAALTPLAMLGLGLAGGAAWLATRRRKKTLGERVATLISERADDAQELAATAAQTGSEAARKAGRTGWSLFKRGRAAAKTAAKEAGKLQDEGSDLAKKALKDGKKLSQKGTDLAMKRLGMRKKASRPGRKLLANAGRSQMILGVLAAALLAYAERMRSQRTAIRVR